MKKVITISSLILLSFVVKSQNLRFNKAFTLGGSFAVGGRGSCGYSDTLRVPAGKVWKLENYIHNDEMHINGVQFYNTNQANTTIWLYSGDIIVFWFCNDNAYGGNHPYYINGIEFDLTP